MAKGVEDTAFYVYNRLVVAQRGGRRPATVRRLASPPSTRATPSGRGAGRTPCSPPRRTTPSAARTCARASTCSPSCPTSGARRCGAGAAQPPRTARVEDAPRPRPQRRVPALPDAARRLAAASRRTRESLARFRERIAAYMLKAVREAKVHTSWINPNEAYEAALCALRRRRCSASARANRSSHDFVPACAAPSRASARQRLSQTLLKLTSPGVPGHLPGHRALGLQPGRPRQPPAGRLRAQDRRAAERWRTISRGCGSIGAGARTARCAGPMARRSYG